MLTDPLPSFLAGLVLAASLSGIAGCGESRSGTAGPRTELRDRLTDLQWEVTMEDGTEPAFRNKYWNNKKPGIYVSVVSGEPLFSSKDKYDSGTGWPSFTKPIRPDAVKEVEDHAYGMSRTEVRSVKADTHLGHVFRDGPRPTGLRYCMNSAALRFIPADQLEEAGFPEIAAEFRDGETP